MGEREGASKRRVQGRDMRLTQNKLAGKGKREGGKPWKEVKMHKIRGSSREQVKMGRGGEEGLGGWVKSAVRERRYLGGVGYIL